MGNPAAKQGDHIVATDTHMTIIQVGPATTVVPLPYVFNGIFDKGMSADVNINGQPAAMVDSTATNTPSHIPQGNAFQKPPSNIGRVVQGSTSVFVNGRPAARAGDTAITCNDPADAPVGKVVASATVLIGG